MRKKFFELEVRYTRYFETDVRNMTKTNVNLTLDMKYNGSFDLQRVKQLLAAKNIKTLTFKANNRKSLEVLDTLVDLNCRVLDITIGKFHAKNLVKFNFREFKFLWECISTLKFKIFRLEIHTEWIRESFSQRLFETLQTADLKDKKVSLSLKIMKPKHTEVLYDNILTKIQGFSTLTSLALRLYNTSGTNPSKFNSLLRAISCKNVRIEFVNRCNHFKTCFSVLQNKNISLLFIQFLKYQVSSVLPLFFIGNKEDIKSIELGAPQEVCSRTEFKAFIRYNCHNFDCFASNNTLMVPITFLESQFLRNNSLLNIYGDHINYEKN